MLVGHTDLDVAFRDVGCDEDPEAIDFDDLIAFRRRSLKARTNRTAGQTQTHADLRRIGIGKLERMTDDVERLRRDGDRQVT
jgi:hypothetical protein